MAYLLKSMRPCVLAILQISDTLPASYRATPITATIDAYMSMACKKVSEILFFFPDKHKLNSSPPRRPYAGWVGARPGANENITTPWKCVLPAVLPWGRTLRATTEQTKKIIWFDLIWHFSILIFINRSVRLLVKTNAAALEAKIKCYCYYWNFVRFSTFSIIIVRIKVFFINRVFI